MQCAVSERLGRGMDTGHRTWLGSFRDAGIEFVVVPDSPRRTRRSSPVPTVDAVLLTEGAPTCAPGAGIQDGEDFRSHRTERELVRVARARGIPVVGIGHGAEFLGLYFGGGLVPRSAPDEPFALRFGAGPGPEPAVATPAGRLVCDPRALPDVLAPIAWDEHDQIVGFVHRSEPILGIHWQPVGPDDGATRLVIDTLRHGMAARRGAETRIGSTTR